MKKETRQNLRELAYISSAGMSFALCVVIGLLIGLYLDQKVWDYEPWGMLGFMALGVAAGVRNLLLIYERAKKIK